ncbi:MAG: DUF3987 domain-containing protein [Planctomycetota bacterium]
MSQRNGRRPRKGDLGEQLAAGGAARLERLAAHARPMRAEPEDEEDQSLPGLPPFPVEALAPGVREVVEGFAASVQAPTELAALPALAVAAAALGPGWRVGPPGLVRPPLLWLVVVAPSGASKTPAARPALAPIYAADTRLREEHALATEGDTTQARQRRHLIVSDATPEALEACLAAADGHGLLAHADELPRLLGGMAGYTPGRAAVGRAAWLSSWSGQPIRVVRKSAAPLEADRPHLCVCAGVQPERLAGVGLSGGDGLLPRFLFALVETRPHGLGAAQDARLGERWEDLVRRALSVGDPGAQPFEQGARALLNERMHHWTERALELGTLGLGLSAAIHAKAADHAVRLAALVHGLDLLDEGPPLNPRPVPLATFERALALMDYFLAHGAAVARMVVATPEDPARAVDTDSRVAGVLLKLLRRGEAREEPPARWSLLLREHGLPLSAGATGKALGRLSADPRPGLQVTRLPRGTARLWRVERQG